MNQKKLVSLIVIVVLAIISQIFSFFDKKEPSKAQEKSTRSSQTHQVSTSSLGNYDVQMKNDRLKQHIVDTDYYTLALSWSPAFAKTKEK